MAAMLPTTNTSIATWVMTWRVSDSMLAPPRRGRWTAVYVSDVTHIRSGWKSYPQGRPAFFQPFRMCLPW